MKLCPACKTVYTDDSLKFCLADGRALESAGDEEPTVVKKGSNGSSAKPAGEIPHASSTWIKFAVGAVVLAVLAIAAAGIIGAIFYYGFGQRQRETATAKSPIPTPIPTIDTEKERLKDELANVQRKLDQQKRSNTNTATFPNNDNVSTATGTVNSPGDGFLALRNAPDADHGDRIAKIPHGAHVVINNCEKTPAVVAGRTGRWCQVEYHGQTGWVFDAWLDR